VDNVTNDVLPWALLYFDVFGWGPVDVDYRKKAAVENMWATKELHREWIESTFGGRERKNLGIRLGHLSNDLVDIDLDCDEAVLFAPYFLPTTSWRFGRHSRPCSHWLYTCLTEPQKWAFPTAETGKDKKWNMIVELRSTGNQTVFPPSVHVSGENIGWVGEPEGTPPVVSKDDLARAVSRVAFASILHRHFPGQGHDARLALAGWLARSQWDETETCSFISTLMEVRGHGVEDVAPLVRDTFRRLEAPEDGKPVMGLPRLMDIMGISKSQADTMARWQRLAAPKLFKESGAGEPPDVLAGQAFKKTDLGNGERFARRYRGTFVYVPAEEEWYRWDKKRWVRDEVLQVRLAAKDMFREMQRDIAVVADLDVEEDEKAQKGSKWAFQCESMARTNAALQAAGPEMAVRATQFDADPWILNVENGVLNLRTGVLDAHDPQLFCAKMAPVVYDAGAQCPRFLRFMEEILPHADTRAYMQRLLGYTLTGDVSEHIFPVLWGTGANGKSTLVEVISGIMGSYATSLPSDELIVSNNPRHETAFARLVGARFVSSSESEQGRRLAEGKIKAVTGGDVIPVRFMHSDYFDMRPTHKIFLMTNHRPQIMGQDEGIWRRIVLIPFSVCIPEAQRDRGLKAQLLSEASGILNWLMEGTRTWVASGLGAPSQEAREATDHYRGEEDMFGMFVEDQCEVGAEYEAEAGKIITAVTQWYERLREHPPKLRGLGGLLRARGFVPMKNSKGVRVWRGLKLRPHTRAEDLVAAKAMTN